MMKQATTLNPVTDMIRQTPPKKARSNSLWSRYNIMIDSTNTSSIATIDCAIARPSTPYRDGLDNVIANTTLRDIVKSETNIGVFVSFWA